MFLSHITPCGECCEGCPKRSDGLCEGCRETDGHCAEWAGSGVCPTYACCKAHGAVFCGLCPEFPCDHLPMLKWRPNCVQELTELAIRYKQRYDHKPTPPASPAKPDMIEIKHNTVRRATCQLGGNGRISDDLLFIQQAVEHSSHRRITVADCARRTAHLYADVLRTGQPEYAAFVFYDCVGVIDGETYGWGHCGLCIGEGKVIHAWDEIRVDDYLALEQLAPLPKWTAPRYLGWVPLERILAQKP